MIYFILFLAEIFAEIKSYNFLFKIFNFRGHCVTPVPYYYDSETTEMIMEEINQNSIRQFFDEFINVQNHKIGSVESANFARNISGIFIF